MVEGGKTPVKTAHDLKSLGFNIVIFPGGAVRAATFQLQEYYAGLLENGSNAEFSKRMHDFDSLNAVIGTPELLSIGKNTNETFNSFWALIWMLSHLLFLRAD